MTDDMANQGRRWWRDDDSTDAPARHARWKARGPAHPPTRRRTAHGLALIIPAEYRARHVAAFHAAIDSGQLAHGGVVARVQALTASGGRLVLGLSLGLLAGRDGQPSGVVGVLRPLGDAAVEFAVPDDGGT